MQSEEEGMALKRSIEAELITPEVPAVGEVTPTPLIDKAITFETIGFRVDIPNIGIPSGATVADIVRYEQVELGNQLGVTNEMLDELLNDNLETEEEE